MMRRIASICCCTYASARRRFTSSGGPGGSPTGRIRNPERPGGSPDGRGGPPPPPSPPPPPPPARPPRDGLAPARLLDETGTREEIVAALVRRDGHDLRVRVEGVLDAVAVVGVDVHVEDAEAARLEVEDREDRVVDVAEPRRAPGQRVVEAAGEVEGARRLAARDQLGGQQRAAGAEPRSVPEPGEHRIVARAEAAALGVRRRDAAVRRLEHVEVVLRVPARDRALERGVGGVRARVRQRREAVRLHDPPREAQSLHPERVLRPVVEARVRVRVDDRGLDHARRRHGPDLPPDFSTSWTFAIVTPLSTPLTMSYTVSAATLTAVSASISTPVLSTVLTRASTASSPRRRSSEKVTSTPVMRSG